MDCEACLVMQPQRMTSTPSMMSVAVSFLYVVVFRCLVEADDLLLAGALHRPGNIPGHLFDAAPVWVEVVGNL